MSCGSEIVFLLILELIQSLFDVSDDIVYRASSATQEASWVIFSLSFLHGSE